MNEYAAPQPTIPVSPTSSAVSLRQESESAPLSSFREHSLAEEPARRTPSRKEKAGKAKVRTYSATDRDMDMLAAISEYHGFSRSGMLASLIRKEFWRCFPSGTTEIRPDLGARVEDGGIQRTPHPAGILVQEGDQASEQKQ